MGIEQPGSGRHRRPHGHRYLAARSALDRLPSIQAMALSWRLSNGLAQGGCNNPTWIEPDHFLDHSYKDARIELRRLQPLVRGCQYPLQVFLVADQHIDIFDNPAQRRLGASLSAQMFAIWRGSSVERNDGPGCSGSLHGLTARRLPKQRGENTAAVEPAHAPEKISCQSKSPESEQRSGCWRGCKDDRRARHSRGRSRSSPCLAR